MRQEGATRRRPDAYGWPALPIAFGTFSSCSSDHDLAISVKNGPADRVFTRTLGANSCARLTLIALSAAFAPEYGQEVRIARLRIRASSRALLEIRDQLKSQTKPPPILASYRRERRSNKPTLRQNKTSPRRHTIQIVAQAKQSKTSFDSETMYIFDIFVNPIQQSPRPFPIAPIYFGAMRMAPSRRMLCPLK